MSRTPCMLSRMTTICFSSAISGPSRLVKHLRVADSVDCNPVIFCLYSFFFRQTMVNERANEMHARMLFLRGMGRTQKSGIGTNISEWEQGNVCGRSGLLSGLTSFAHEVRLSCSSPGLCIRMRSCLHLFIFLRMVECGHGDNGRLYVCSELLWELCRGYPRLGPRTKGKAGALSDVCGPGRICLDRLWKRLGKGGACGMIKWAFQESARQTLICESL